LSSQKKTDEIERPYDLDDFRAIKRMIYVLDKLIAGRTSSSGIKSASVRIGWKEESVELNYLELERFRLFLRIFYKQMANEYLDKVNKDLLEGL
jgi:hypothetical protein